MKILVPIKSVVDPDLHVYTNQLGTDLEIPEVKYVINPFDEISLEEAVRIKDKTGAEVVIITIGPDHCRTQIQTALAIGADRAIFIRHDQLVGSYEVAQLISKVAENENPDLILMGKQAVDHNGSQVGPMLAFHLNWPQACFISELQLLDNSVMVKREIDVGIESLELPLPAILTVDLRLNEPRYPTLPNILKAKKKTIDVYSIADFELDLSQPVEVLSFENPPQRIENCKYFENVDALLNELASEAKISWK